MIDEYSRRGRTKVQNTRVSNKLSREVKHFNIHLALPLGRMSEPSHLIRLFRLPMADDQLSLFSTVICMLRRSLRVSMTVNDVCGWWTVQTHECRSDDSPQSTPSTRRTNSDGRCCLLTLMTLNEIHNSHNIHRILLYRYLRFTS